MQSIRTLLAGIIDYAGLFPPADLPMASAASNYARYRNEPHAWMLGRFILPAARLEEFAAAAEPVLKREQAPWKLSALCTLPLSPDLQRIEEFRSRKLPAEVDTIEIKAARPGDIPAALDGSASGFTAYFEIPLSGESEAFLQAIGEIGARAKMRTGGATPESIPDPHSVAQFLRSCADADVPFKATAGLHHPLYGVHRLIPGDDGRRATMHGFLNVFLASAYARAGAAVGELTNLLQESSLAAFQFGSENVRWRDHEISKSLLLRVRQSFAIAFGSCSFDEPVSDLKTLSLL